MNTKRLILSAIAALVLATPAFAACEQVVVTVKPDIAAVYGPKTTKAGSGGTPSTSGANMWSVCDPLPTAYDKYFSFCDATVTNVKSQSEKVDNYYEPNAFLGNYGYVADITGRQFYVIIAGNRVNLGGPQVGQSCP